MTANRALATIICGVAVFYWLTLPPARVALNNACEPQDIMARISAGLHGASFWRAQDAAISESLQVLAAVPAATERARETQKGSMSAIESKMTRLSSNETGNAETQAETEAREQRERLEQMGWLVRCQGVVSQHLTR
jgi:hypothetical protein